MISPTIQKMLVVLVTIGVLLYLALGLFNKVSDTSVGVASLSETETASQDILTLVDKMRRMSIDSSVFTSPLFTRLIDFSAITTPELRGRPNPFAPIGVDQLSVQTASANNSTKPKTTP